MRSHKSASNLWWEGKKTSADARKAINFDSRKGVAETKLTILPARKG